MSLSTDAKSLLPSAEYTMLSEYGVTGIVAYYNIVCVYLVRDKRVLGLNDHYSANSGKGRQSRLLLFASVSGC